MIWTCRDKKIEYGKNVLIMGIVNVTPDSFSDGGDCFDEDRAVNRALELEKEGADIIDIGAQSTRPDYTPVSEDEEWRRLEPVLKKLTGKITVPVSVDTYYPSVAEKALNLGVDIINDVSGVASSKMAKVVKNKGCGWILMYNGAGATKDVQDFFKKALKECGKLGVSKDQLCFDMGIGFGKSYEENMELLTHIKDYRVEGCPLLLGVSRKKVIGKGSEQENPKERVYGNIAADTVAILGGVDIIRLHDVKNEKQGIKMAESLKEFYNG